MSFLHPALAWAAVGAVALPIVIHLLFRRRRVPVDWAAMEILREAIRRTNRKLRFEQWIVLTLRALTILMAGLAIAVPIFGDAASTVDREKTWVAVIDHGATSALSVGAESELARLREAVSTSIERSRGTGDRFAIVSAASEPSLVLAPTADFTEFQRALARIQPSETPSDLIGAVRLARETARESGDEATRLRRVFVASSFRRGALREGEMFGVSSNADSRQDASGDATAASERATTPTNIEFFAVSPAVELPTDVRIERLETRALPSGEAFLVRAFLSREGSNLEAAESRVRVTGELINPVSTRVVTWDAGQSESTVEFQVVPQKDAQDNTRRRCELMVSIDDDVLPVGNNAFAVIDVRREIEVAVIGRRTSLDGADLEKVPGSLWIARALMPSLGASTGIRVRDIDPASCDTRALLGVDVVILARPDLVSPASCDVIGAFVREGGVAVVLPSGESMAQTWGPTLLPRLGVAMRVGPEAREFETPLQLREEQPASNLLSSIAPELPALCAPIEVRRAMTIEGVTGAEAVLLFTDGTPFVAAQSPKSAEEMPTGNSNAPPAVGMQGDGIVESEREAVSGVSSRSLSGSSDGVLGGLVVCVASSPELAWTNLPVKPLMVPLFQEIVRTGVELASSSDEVMVGDRLRVAREGVFRLTDPTRESAAIDVGRDGVSTAIVPFTGVWKGDDGMMIAANVRSASLALTPNTQEAVRAAFQPLGGVQIAEVAVGATGFDEATRSSVFNSSTVSDDSSSWTRVWSFALLVAALVFLLAEGVLSRVFSHASLAQNNGRAGAIETVGRVRSRASAVAQGDRAASAQRVGTGGAQ